jgi:hypothetical protein
MRTWRGRKEGTRPGVGRRDRAVSGGVGTGAATGGCAGEACGGEEGEGVAGKEEGEE